MEHLNLAISNSSWSSINLRQNSAKSISFATIINGASSATISIDTNGVAVGVYTLTLETYDSSASAPQATINTDTIKIYVTEYVRSVEFESTITVM